MFVLSRVIDMTQANSDDDNANVSVLVEEDQT